MREFFKGWRRKAGCVTLVMVLLLTSAWIRSYVAGDVLRVEFRDSPRKALSYYAESVHGGVRLSRHWTYWTGDSFPPTYRFGPCFYTTGAADFEWWPETAEPCVPIMSETVSLCRCCVQGGEEMDHD